VSAWRLEMPRLHWPFRGTARPAPTAGAGAAAPAGERVLPALPTTIEDFGFPITLAFSSDGRVYLTERITGRLWRIDHGEYRVIKTFPVAPLIGHNETGLLGIAVDPDFETNGYIYCYYTAGTSEKDFKNRVVRINDDGTNEMVVLDNIPAGMIHNGGILAFAPDKTLFIGVGVGNDVREQAQDTHSLAGKILRINRDGTVPEDNPFPQSPVYSYGHRNIFGIAFHPKTGKAYVSDVGPDRNDEINIIEKGGNYGWPEVTGKARDSRFIDPIQTYTPTITPTQNVFVDGDLYFGSFNEGSVHKLTLSGSNYDTVVKDDVVYKGAPFGVVGVFYGSDRQFYVTTPSSIIQFTPTQ
jgi:glucose/arabinose dehydrogenase